jgi:hypothetical protein
MAEAVNGTPQFGSTGIAGGLPDVLDYTGEFGAELVLFLPLCEWLSSQRLLLTRSIRTYAGMGCFYERLQCRAIVEKHEERRYISPKKRPDWMPVRDEHEFDVDTSKRFLRYPDLRARFASYKVPRQIALSEKPILIIHNKYNLEWDFGPINHIPLDLLDQLLSELSSRYTVVYVRHTADSSPGYSKDHNISLAFDDRKVLERYPTVLNFEDLYKAQDSPYDLNTFKNAIYSRCYHFISSQGGGAHHIALFSGSLIAIFHKAGHETRWAYSDGYYSFMANPPPVRLICADRADLIFAVPAFERSSVVRGRVRFDNTVEHVLTRLSPARLRVQDRSIQHTGFIPSLTAS